MKSTFILSVSPMEIMCFTSFAFMVYCHVSSKFLRPVYLCVLTLIIKMNYKTCLFCSFNICCICIYYYTINEYDKYIAEHILIQNMHSLSKTSRENFQVMLPSEVAS